MIKGSFQEEDITLVNIHAPDTYSVSPMSLIGLRTCQRVRVDLGSIPSLTQWVTDPALLQTAAWVTDVAQIQRGSLAVM